MTGQQKLEQYRQELIKWRDGMPAGEFRKAYRPEPKHQDFGIPACCTPESFLAKKIREEVLGRNA